MCRREKNHFEVPFGWIGPVLFPSKDGKDAVYERRNGGMCLFPAKVGNFPL